MANILCLVEGGRLFASNIGNVCFEHNVYSENGIPFFLFLYTLLISLSISPRFYQNFIIYNFLPVSLLVLCMFPLLYIYVAISASTRLK